jgi:hemerythrin superfamily protein
MAIRTTIEKATQSVMNALSGQTGNQADIQSDILETLQQEHDEVQELLDKLVKSQTAREQKALVGKIKAALVPHTKAEEKVIYDRVLALKDVAAKIDGNEGYVEHGLAGDTLKKLDKLTANTPAFKASAKVLKELIDHHVREEERNIWSRVKDNFSLQERAELNREFLAAKRKVRVG